MSIRECARQAVRAIQAPMPARDSTLHVTGVPADWPPEVVATYVTRAALELGCARIAVHRPATAPVGFDVVDTIRGVARQVGYWPRPPITRRGPIHGFALTGLRGLGAGIDRVRRWVPVPQLPFPGHTGGKE